MAPLSAAYLIARTSSRTDPPLLPEKIWQLMMRTPEEIPSPPAMELMPSPLPLTAPITPATWLPCPVSLTSCTEISGESVTKL